MTKKKNKKNNNIPRDFTINDSANAPIPVKAIRKSATVAKPEMEASLEASWDEISDDVDISLSADNKQLVLQKKKEDKSLIRPEGEYPEILYYLLSRYIKPEDIGTFAGINKSTYAITKSKAFWLLQYKRYCENAPLLPQKFRSESLKAYGLRQTVIRALYYTYEKFTRRMIQRDTHPSNLLNWVCVNMWFNRGLTYWNVYFKLKKPQIHSTPTRVTDRIEEMGRVDANPEEGAQVLMVICKGFDRIPPLTGLTLSTVKMVLSQGYRHHTLYLGFNRSCYNVKSIVPECEIILDAVVKAIVCKWWHPQYPHSSNFIPRQDGPTLLVKDFFDDHEDS